MTDACLALFASIGIWTLGRWFLDWILNHDHSPEVLIAVRACGDGDELDRAVKWLTCRWHRSKILLVDCGLSSQGRAKVQALISQSVDVRSCTREQTGTLMKEAETWTKRKNTTK